MNNYKINLIYNENTHKTINDIIIKVLEKEIKNYVKAIYKNNSLSNISQEIRK